MPPYPPEETQAVFAKNYDSIPTLNSYERIPDENFWERFPKRDLPKSPSTRINIENLEKVVREAGPYMTKSELHRAKRVIHDLRNGADAYQNISLPPITAKNAKSALKYGELMTDKLASWIDKGFVAGPFNCPPLPGFRGNPLMAIARNGKIRPVLNMSGPAGKSFNDNVVTRKLEKVNMSTAKAFSMALRKAGKGARFSKFDICDAYKLIPAKTADLRLQGFTWLGKYFCETQGTFGGIGSVCNFDRLGNTKDTLVCIRSQTPKDTVFRILDDSPNVAAEGSGIAERFAREMRSLCKFINLPLAENCPKNDKAFELQSRGIVLGVGFDSSNMTWFLTEEKANRVIRRCLNAANSGHLDLKQTQQLMGSVNDFCQMCPLLRFHKSTGNGMLAKFNGNENILLPVTRELRDDLLTLAKAAYSSKLGLPIACEIGKPPLSVLTFYTDAAGASFSISKGKRVFHDQGERGLSCIGGTNLDDIWIWARLTWPVALLTELRDSSGKFFGCKSTTLESIGLLIPFVAFPDQVQGRHILFKVDNIAVHYGWENGYVKYDSTANEILKCVHLLSAHLGVSVYVEHVPRMSDDMASLADELSRRESPKDHKLRKVLRESEERKVEGYLLHWLQNPSATDLFTTLLNELMLKITY